MKNYKFKAIDEGGINWVYGLLQGSDNTGRFYINDFRVKTGTIGQFSGLIDCNGIEIYENDFVFYKNGSLGICKGVVVFEDGCFYVEYKRFKTKLSDTNEFQRKHGGNVFDYILKK